MSAVISGFATAAGLCPSIGTWVKLDSWEAESPWYTVITVAIAVAIFDLTICASVKLKSRSWPSPGRF
jgi:hypothetical protein